MLIKLCKIIIIALTLNACGNYDRVREREPDPDTMNAIKKHNLQIIEGNWSVTLDSGEVGQLKIEGDRYEASRPSQFYDQGHVEHKRPGHVLLISDRPDCDRKVKNLIMTFERRTENSFLETSGSPEVRLYERSATPMNKTNNLCRPD